MTSAPLPSYHANRRGILALTSACALFTINDTLTKLTILLYPASEVLFIRGLGSILCIGAALAYAHQLTWVAAAVRPIVLLRAALEATAHVAFIVALGRMRLAELLAINLASPLLLTMLLAFFFKDPIGWRRWLAVLVGLAGTLFIVKPSPDAINVWALLGLAGAAASALRDVTNRRIHGAVPTLAITFVSLLAVTVAGLVLSAVLGDRWVMVAPKYLSFVGIAAFFLSVGSYLAVSAFRKVDITVVAPFRYTLLIWGGLSGYLVFNELPDAWSVVGVSLIVASGLYTLHRERVRHRELSAKATIH